MIRPCGVLLVHPVSLDSEATYGTYIKKRTYDWWQNRQERSSYGTLFFDLREEYDLFSKYIRFYLPLFEYLLSKIEQKDL